MAARALTGRLEKGQKNRLLILLPTAAIEGLQALQAMLRCLRKQRAQWQLELAGRPCWQPLLKRLPEAAELRWHPLPPGGFWQFLQQAKALRQRHFMQVLLCGSDWRSAWLATLSAIPLRTAYREGRYLLINDPRQRRFPDRLRRAWWLALAHGQSMPLALSLPLLAASREQRERLLGQFQLALERPVVVFAFGRYKGPAHCWPVDYVRALAAYFKGIGWQVWLLGNASDRAQLGDCGIDLCGLLSAVQCLDLLSAVDCVVGHDGPLLHLAAAVGVPVIALYGPSHPQSLQPASGPLAVCYQRLSCSPCNADYCPLGHGRCMADIRPEAVVVAARSLGLQLPDFASSERFASH